MTKRASRPPGAVQVGSAMRPRRWYTAEVAPPQRRTKLTAQAWRYQSRVQRRMIDAAPPVGAASTYCQRSLGQAQTYP